MVKFSNERMMIMSTKECLIKRYCCFYVSDYHLEMILLPYIKNKLDKSKIIIYTEENLLESLKELLNKTNFKEIEKKKIINIDSWKNKEIIDFSKIGFEECTVIINGNIEYIEKINNKIKFLNCKIINIIDCYNLNNIQPNMKEIKEKYEEILNSKYK